MCKRFDEWSSDIRNYCENNGLSFAKASKLAKCWGADDLILQYYDDEKAKTLTSHNEEPMPVVLYIKRENGKLVFTQTEHTAKYLAL